MWSEVVQILGHGEVFGFSCERRSWRVLKRGVILIHLTRNLSCFVENRWKWDKTKKPIREGFGGN